MTETIVGDMLATGKNDAYPFDEIVEAAFVDLDDLAPLLNTRVRPTQPIPDAAVARHGISNTMVASAPSFADILPQIIEIVRGRTLWFWHHGADMTYLLTSAWLSGVYLPDLFGDVKCAMRQYAAMFGAPNWDGTHRWQKLGAAYEQQFGRVEPPMPDALGNATMTARLILRMADADAFRTASGNTFPVMLHSMRVEEGTRSYYVRITTRGGQAFNVFHNQFGRFEAAGVPINEYVEMLLNDGDTYTPFTFPTPVMAYLRLDGKYPELDSVGE
jgi:DNA polymerase-3 subunit epsilon